MPHTDMMGPKMLRANHLALATKKLLGDVNLTRSNRIENMDRKRIISILPVTLKSNSFKISYN